MSEVVDPKKPIVRGRASIIHSQISVTVLWREQLHSAINWLIANNYEFSWEINTGDSLTPDTFVLNVDDIIWAHNLQEFAAILTECDFEQDKYDN